MYQNGEIGDKCKQYLTSTHGRTSELYLLPTRPKGLKNYIFLKIIIIILNTIKKIV